MSETAPGGSSTGLRPYSPRTAAAWARRYVPRISGWLISNEGTFCAGKGWRHDSQEVKPGCLACFYYHRCEQIDLPRDKLIQVYFADALATADGPVFDTQLVCQRCLEAVQQECPGKLALVDW